MKITKKTYLLFVLPVLIPFFITVLIPFFLGAYYSLTDWNGASSDFNLVGFANFAKLFSDKDFKDALGLTILFSLISIILINIIGLSLAFLVTRKMKIRNFLRATYFFPNLVGGLILGFIWQFIFTEVFIYLHEITKFSIFFNWLKEPVFAFLALIFVTTWQMAGYIMIIYIAAIQNIPDDIIEAASIDGASNFKKLIKIKLPLMMNGFTVSLFITLASTLKLYDTNLSLTGGGPYLSTQLITMNIFQEAFSYQNFGYAQSKAIIFLIIIALITISQVILTKRKEVEY